MTRRTSLLEPDARSRPLVIGQVVCDLRAGPRGGLDSGHASTRLRALEPSRALSRRGHRIRIHSDRHLRADAANGSLYEADVTVVHKARTDLSGVLEQLRSHGVRVVLDVCDHVFALPHLAQHYPDMMARADLLTTPTEALAATLSERTDRPVRVVPDAIEGPRGAPHPGVTGATVRLLWFGRSTNLAPLIAALPRLGCRALGLDAVLEVVSDAGPGFAALLRARPADLQIVPRPWSADEVARALERCDLVVLPTDRDPTRIVKSANRMERALWGGRLSVVTPMPVYEPYGPVVFADEDPAQGVRIALAARSEWTARIVRGQDMLATSRSATALAPLWESAVREACTITAGVGTVSARLHMYGGRQSLPGYLSVDGEGEPDILAEPHRPLPFASGSVVEVLAVDRPQGMDEPVLDAVLAEWVRVLKPGGRLVLEAPHERVPDLRRSLTRLDRPGAGIQLETGHALFLGGPRSTGRLVATRRY